MKTTVNVLVATLIALGGTAIVWGRAQAQNSCVTQCRGNGWAEDQCKKYCETRPDGSR